eukprot:16432276-Heterocapsa_arctica.AAC.1
MVARLLTAKEIAEDPNAQQAIITEGGNLEKPRTWDLSSVTEKWDLIRDAKAKGETIHLALVFPICSEKGSELPAGDPDCKMKGRCVSQGSDVPDENHQTAICQELSSSPATLEGA